MAQMIKTKRLVLRQIAMTDAPAVVAGVAPLAVSRWLTHVPHPYGMADAVDFVSRNEGLFPEVCAVTLDGAFTGVAGVRRELGYWYAEPFWGLGIATEAAAALVRCFFEQGREPVLTSGYLQGNARSRNVLTKLGFFEAQLEEVTPLSTGVPTRLQKMELRHSQWEGRS
jgi:RimJ/RimL family protein N-acetyltransferase